MRISPEVFEQLGRDMILKGRRLCKEEENRRFRGNFGASFNTISELWNKLNPKRTISHRAQGRHLLWTMVYLKVNRSESVHCTLVGCNCRETYRTWTRWFVHAICELESEVILLSNRFKGWDGDTRCLMVIDGTDVESYEPHPYNPVWWSHKFNGPGLRYAAATCIKSGDIVWFRGPFPCTFSDKEIFDLFLSEHLIPGEGVEADSGYQGRSQLFLPGMGRVSSFRKQKSQVRGRHENVNGLGVMKKWESVDMERHAIAARAVAVIVQLSFSIGEKLYTVDYNVDYD